MIVIPSLATYTTAQTLGSLSRIKPSPPRKFSPMALASSRQCARLLFGLSVGPSIGLLDLDFALAVTSTSSGKKMMSHCGNTDCNIRSCIYAVPFHYTNGSIKTTRTYLGCHGISPMDHLTV